MDEETCSVCDGLGWVCEAHPSQPWGDGGSDRFDACHCGAPGEPCPACNAESPPRMIGKTIFDADGWRH